MSEASFQPYLQQPFLEVADLLYQSSERLAQQLNFAAQAEGISAKEIVQRLMEETDTVA